MPFDVRQVRVDQIFQREAGIDEFFNRFVSMPIDVPIDACRVVRHLIEHATIGRREPGVVLEEVAMPVNVSDHQLLIADVVRIQQVRVTRIRIDHHFVDLLQTVRITLHQLVVLRTEPPVRITDREPGIRGEHAEFFVVDVFKDRLVKVQPFLASLLLHVFLDRGNVARKRSIDTDSHNTPWRGNSDDGITMF